MRQFLFLLLLTYACQGYAGEQLPDLVQCAQANVPESLSLRRVNFVTTDRVGRRSRLDARIYATREQVGGPDDKRLRAMMQVDAPEYLKNAAYLVRESSDSRQSEMFVYLPSVGRVRSVKGELTDGALMGTKFSYYEFQQLSNAFRDLSPQIQGSGEIDGRAVTRVRFTPLDPTTTHYTSVLAWIDEETCLPLRADFSEGDTVIKRLTAPANAIAGIEGRWYLKQIKIRVLADDTYSVMRVENASLEAQVSDYYFDPKTFFTVQ